MTQRSLTMVSMNTMNLVGYKGQPIKPDQDAWVSSQFASTQDEQRYQQYLERQRLLAPKVERCAQEIIERIEKEKASLKFELLALPNSHQIRHVPVELKEFYFDFYLVWKRTGQIDIERDQSSVCCQIKSIKQDDGWSRAEQQRLLLRNPSKKRAIYLNGRGLRDLLFESIHQLKPELVRLDFVEHLIYFDLIIPSLSEKITCHITFLPCIHQMADDQDIMLPFGTLRWYPRSLNTFIGTARPISFQQPLQSLTIRHFISNSNVPDELTKLTKADHQEFARIRTILREFLSPTTLEHIDSIDILRIALLDGDESIGEPSFFIPHRTDRNCNVFPAGQRLFNGQRARRFFRQFLRNNLVNENAT